MFLDSLKSKWKEWRKQNKKAPRTTATPRHTVGRKVVYKTPRLENSTNASAASKATPSIDVEKSGTQRQKPSITTHGLPVEIPDCSEIQPEKSNSLTPERTRQSQRPDDETRRQPSTAGKSSFNTERRANSPGGYIPREEAREEEDLAAQRNDHIQSLGVSDLFPREVPCRLVIFFKKERIDWYSEIQVVWQKNYSSRFREIDHGARRLLADKYGIRSDQLYRTAGECRLLRIDSINRAEQKTMEVVVDAKNLQFERQWSIVTQQLVGGFFGQQRNYGKKCKLELHWTFSSLNIPHESKISLPGTNATEDLRTADDICNVVREKFQRNWRGQLFLPKTDFLQIFTTSTVKSLLKSDESLKRLENEEEGFSIERFQKDVIADGVRLLAICLYSDMPLECLHRMMQTGVKNSSLPLKEGNLPNGLHKLKGMKQQKCDQFLSQQGSFIPHIFDQTSGPPEYKRIPDEVVIPVIFEDSEANRLGHGSFGEVFPATIWPGHHNFPANQEFALKRWKQWDDFAEAFFEKEEGPLQKLHGEKCGNIVLHLAAWSQGQLGSGRRFYMLFPRAECNLASYLMTYPAPELSPEHVLWLFQQLFELVDAIDQLHILNPKGSETHGSSSLTLPPVHRKGGQHHDLKPANILAFPDPETGKHVFKITDFGSAKLDFALASKSMSQGESQTKNFAGDPVYKAPDGCSRRDGKPGQFGRRADIWSLGCCFLEILLWNFGDGGVQNLEHFKQKRFEVPLYCPPANDAAFWYFDVKEQVPKLKPAVVNKLIKLRRICHSRGQFQTLLETIEIMLAINPYDRKSAATHRSAFKAMRQEVSANLNEDKDYYKTVHPSAAHTFAPVTTVSRTPSRDGSTNHQKFETVLGRQALPMTLALGEHRRSFSDPSSIRTTVPGIEPEPSDTTMSGAHLEPPNDQSTPNGNRSRAPSIEISDYSTMSIGPRGQAIIGGLYGPPTRDEIPTLRRKHSGSTPSATM